MNPTTPNYAQQAQNNFGFQAPKAMTPFSSIMPYDKVFNPSLIQNLSESQVMPDVQRQQNQAMYGLNQGLASTGGFRSGQADFQRQNLANQYQRQGAEQTQGFSDSINNYLNDWYNKQYTQYYENPNAYNAPKVPDMNSYLQQNPNLSAAYNQQTNVQNKYKNPYLF